jgi:subtilisin family serine protease
VTGLRPWSLVAALAFLMVPGGGPICAAENGARLVVADLDAHRPAASLLGLRARGATVVRMLSPTRVLVDWPGGDDPAPMAAWRPGEARAHLKAILDVPNAKTSALLPIAASVMPRDAGRLATVIEDLGAEVSWTAVQEPTVVLGTWLSAADLERLGARCSEEGIDLVVIDLAPGARLANATSALWTGAYAALDQGINGDGQVIGIMDTGIDADHCFFADPAVGLPVANDRVSTDIDPDHRKIAAVDFWWDEEWPDPDPLEWDTQGHGTHVAGSAAGDGEAVGIHDGNDGMAPGARLVIQDGGARVDDCGDLPGLGCPMRPLGPMLEQAWRQGARIHSNSWGDEENYLPYGRYTERTADVDRFVWEHPDMVVVAAAGNAGSEGNDSVISPSTGKNVISVGASRALGDPLGFCAATFSSRGWTHDGRIKPDVLAPGSGVLSAQSDGVVTTDNCGQSQKSGTSMATPTVAGLAALVRQFFVEGRHRTGTPDAALAFEPSAALVRATLIASARDNLELGCIFPDWPPSRSQGWGNVSLDRVMWRPGQSHRLVVFDDRVGLMGDDGDRFERRVHLGLAGRLDVVLVWTDPPSTAVATTNLVHDLDLEVRGPNGERFLGNVFHHGASTPGGEADRLNPVEVIRLPDAASGTWTIRVSAVSTALGRQPFAVVAVGGLLRSDAPRDPGPGGRAAGG